MFPTYDTLLESYFTDLRVKNWSETTIDRRASSLKRFIDWLKAREIHSLEEVTHEMVESYQRSLYHVGNLRNGKPIRFQTQASYLIAIKHWCNWACLKKHLRFDPAAAIELPKEEHRLPGSFLSIEEVELLINQPDISTVLGLRDRAILEVLYATAMRRMELLNLTDNDLDRVRRLVVIRQGKGKKDRVVPITHRALMWLEKYLSEAREILAAGLEGRRQVIVAGRPSDRLILGNSGNPMGKEFLSSLVRRYIKEAGLNKTGGCHILRHTAATLMLENGADLRSLQTLLGHQSLNSTQIYTHITIERLRAVYDATHPGNESQTVIERHKQS